MGVALLLIFRTDKNVTLKLLMNDSFGDGVALLLIFRTDKNVTLKKLLIEDTSANGNRTLFGSCTLLREGMVRI